MIPLAKSPRAASLALALFLACVGAACGGAPSSGAVPETPETLGGLAVVDPEDPEHPWSIELGTVPDGETVERVVRLENRLRAADGEPMPLTIRSILSGCSCTLPSISYAAADGTRVHGDPRAGNGVITLPPGAVAELVLHVDTRSAPVKNRPKLIVIRIVTDSPSDPYLSLEVRVLVDAPFGAAPPLINLGPVGVNAGGAGAVDVYAVHPEQEREIVRVLEAPPNVETELERKPLGPGLWTLRARLLPPIPQGHQEYVIRLGTTGPGGIGEGRPFEVRLAAQGTPDVQILPERLLLAVPPGGGAERAEAEILSRIPGQRFAVVGARLEGGASDRLRVELVPASPDQDGRSGRWLVRLVASEPLVEPAVAGKLVLRLDDSQFPELQAAYLKLAP
jgi:hypothetical protein